MKPVVVRAILAAVVSLTAILDDKAATAETYPARPITAVIPFAAGSASDVVSRILFERMGRAMGQTIVVENRAGAGGNTGTALVARAKPDGYTLIGAGSGPIGANVSLYKNLGYDPVKDLDIISPFAGFTIVVVASEKLPVKSLKELITYAKANPGLNYGSVGIGSSQHLAGEYFSQVTGVKMTHVPYKNIGQYSTDMIAGSVPLGFQWFPNVSGPLGFKGARALAVAGDNRLAALPDTPTTTEAGLPQYKMSGWFALAAPAGTPKPILERLNRELAAAIKDPVVRDNFAKVGAEPMTLPLDQAKKFLISEIAQYRDIVAKGGIQIE